MIQCENCEFFEPDELGNPGFKCDPFRNIKEEACLAKWQLIQMNQLLNSYSASTAFQQKLAPLQEKMFKMVSREMEEMEEAESWKQSYEGEDEEEDRPSWM